METYRSIVGKEHLLRYMYRQTFALLIGVVLEKGAGHAGCG